MHPNDPNYVHTVDCSCKVLPLTVEGCNSKGQGNGRAATLQLGRDRLRNIVLMARFGPQHISYHLTARCSVHRKFTKQGRASIVVRGFCFDFNSLLFWDPGTFFTTANRQRSAAATVSVYEAIGKQNNATEAKAKGIREKCEIFAKKNTNTKSVGGLCSFFMHLLPQ